MKHTALAAIALAALQTEAQVSWTAHLSNPDFPSASGTVTATIQADTLLNPWVFFKSEWVNIAPIDRTMVLTELGGYWVGDTLASGDTFTVPISQWPSKNLGGCLVEINNGYIANNLYGQFGAVPEPSTYALLSGLGLVAFAVARRVRV